MEAPSLTAHLVSDCACPRSFFSSLQKKPFSSYYALRNPFDLYLFNRLNSCTWLFTVSPYPPTRIPLLSKWLPVSPCPRPRPSLLSACPALVRLLSCFLSPSPPSSRAHSRMVEPAHNGPQFALAALHGIPCVAAELSKPHSHPTFRAPENLDSPSVAPPLTCSWPRQFAGVSLTSHLPS